MKAYLNDKERLGSKFLALLEYLLESSYNDSISRLNLDKESLIYDTYSISDPVLEFLNYYNQDSNSNLDKVTIEYIKNALYAMKGAPAIIDIVSEFIGSKIEYTYEFPKFTVMRISALNTSNPSMFITKFKDLLYYLLFYTELKVTIDHLVLMIKGYLGLSEELVTGMFTQKTLIQSSNEF